MLAIATLAGCSGGGSAGAPGPADQAVKTDDGAWHTPESIDSGNGNASAPQIVMDANGNAITVWTQDDGSAQNIYASRYTPASGWSAAQVIETGSGTAAAPQIAMDANGNAIAVWAQDENGAGYSIYANRFTPDTGWSTAQLIETASGGASIPQIAVDPNGNAIAVWEQDDGIAQNIYANRYTPGAGWESAQSIKKTDTSSSLNSDGRAPRISVDANGNAIAVWCQAYGTTQLVYARRYVPGTGWGPEREIGGADWAYSPQIAVDADGYALAVFIQHDDIPDHYVYASHFTPGTGWDTIGQLLESSNLDARDPRLVFDASGSAIAVWSQQDGTSYSIYADRYTRGSGWGFAKLIETGSGDAATPQIAFDPSGNAIAVWSQQDGTAYSIYAHRFDWETGWSAAQLIETAGGDAATPQIAFDANGKAIAVWSQQAGSTYRIFASRFD